MIVPLEHVIALAGVLFAIGAVGAIARRELLASLLSIQLMFAAGNLVFLAFARWRGDPALHGFAWIGLVLAAIQAGIGLAIVAVWFRSEGSLDGERASRLKW